MKKNYKIFIIVYVALFLLCVTVVYGFPSAKEMMVKTYIAKTGEINLTDETKGYIVRDEVVYKAKKAGEVKRVADEGKLIKAWSKVVDISGEGAEKSTNRKYPELMDTLGKKAESTGSGQTSIAGYVSYSADGAEGKLNKSKSIKMSKDKLTTLADADLLSCAEGKCAKGDPLFKVTRNGKWYMIIFLDNKTAKKYEEGSSVQIEVNGETLDADVGSVEKLKKTPGESRVVLKCGMFYKGYLTDRIVDVKITTAGAEGLILSDKSVVKKKGKKGVLVKNKLGKYVFKPICIKADDGENCVVYQDIFMDEDSNFVETLKIYDEVVASPSESDVKNAG